MKNAYLIIAHDDFEILNLSLSCLDVTDNDIYIHFDSKIKSIPELKVQNAKLYILKDRIDVRWGSVSLVEVELLLFQNAYTNGYYDYYHLMSGMDMPIKSQEYINQFLEANKGKLFVGFTQGDISEEMLIKVKKRHLFTESFRDIGSLAFFKRFLRHLHLRFQQLLNIKRNSGIDFKKGTQWVSITHDFVEYVLSKKEEILTIYKDTFCSDEIFLQTLCWNSYFKNDVYDISNSRNSSKRFIQWSNNKIIDWELKDVEYLISSSGLFARKFSKNNYKVAQEIYKRIKN